MDTHTRLQAQKHKHTQKRLWLNIMYPTPWIVYPTLKIVQIGSNLFLEQSLPRYTCNSISYGERWKTAVTCCWKGTMKLMIKGIHIIESGHLVKWKHWERSSNRWQDSSKWHSHGSKKRKLIAVWCFLITGFARRLHRSRFQVSDSFCGARKEHGDECGSPAWKRDIVITLDNS